MEQAMKEQGLCGKKQRQIFSCMDQTSEVNKEFIIIMAFGFFLHHF